MVTDIHVQHYICATITKFWLLVRVPFFAVSWKLVNLSEPNFAEVSYIQDGNIYVNLRKILPVFLVLYQERT